MSASTTWQQAGFTYTRTNTSDDGTHCAATAYGHVRRYLTDRPCSSLTRAAYTATDSANDTLLVAVSWTTMPTATTAAELQHLAKLDGTGNITELTTNGVRFTGRYYDSRLAATTVIIAEAEPTTGSNPDTTTLHQAATTALSLPRP